MVHTFEELRTLTPPKPQQGCPGGRHAAGGMRNPPPGRGPGPPPPTHARKPPPVAPDHPPPGMGHWRPTAPPPTPPPSHREGKGQGQGKGKGRERTPRQGGGERPKVAGRRPQGQGTGGDTTRGQETIKGPGRGRTRGPRTEGEDATTGTRAHTQEGHATAEGPAPPHPQPTRRDPQRRTPAKTRRQSTDLTMHEPHRLTPTDHRTPYKGRRAHPHGEKVLPPPRQLPRTQPRSPPPRLHRQATTPATARPTTQATAQAPEEEEDTAAIPRTRGKDPQRTRDQGTGPQGGQPRGHPPDPPTRTAHPDRRSTDPTSHTTPNRALQPPAIPMTLACVPHHETGQSNQRRPHSRLEQQ